MYKNFVVALTVLAALCGCNPAAPVPVPTPSMAVPTPTPSFVVPSPILQPSPTVTPTPTVTVTPTQSPSPQSPSPTPSIVVSTIPSAAPILSCTATVGPVGATYTTISKAAAAAKPGSVICVTDGNYTDYVYLAVSGTPSAWIKFVSVNPLGAKITASGWAAFDANSQKYIEFNGFDITNPTTGRGITAGLGSHHIRVVGNSVHGCGEGGIGIAQSDYADIENNTVFGNAFTNPDDASGISLWELNNSDTLTGFHNVIRGNIVYGNDNHAGALTDGNGIIIDDSQNTQKGRTGGAYTGSTLIEKNIVMGNGGAGITSYHSDNVTVQYNTVYWNHTRKATGTWLGDLSNTYSNNNTWLNNISVASTAYNVANVAALEELSAGTLWKGNVTFNGTAGVASITTDNLNTTLTLGNGNLLGVNPLFVNPGVSSAADFHLLSSSPAIGKGAL